MFENSNVHFESKQSNTREEMNHAVTLILLLMQVFAVQVTVSQSNQWYNWFEDNKDNRFIDKGILPTLSCPYGYYRQFKMVPHEPGGINLDGCMKCPMGVFGNATDLTSPNCTAPCPIGTYSDEEGIRNIDDCKKCPAGTYGEKEGLTTPQCSGSCSQHNRLEFEEQFFSMIEGLTSPERKSDEINLVHENIIM